MAMGLDGMIATPDVAKILGVSESRVRQFVFHGRLKPAKKLGVNLLFDRRTVEAFAKKPRVHGRPKKSEKVLPVAIAKSKRPR
jgi:hypothetical protein